jgi:CubicO group peptidase (beta-lactamase class C family)
MRSLLPALRLAVTWLAAAASAAPALHAQPAATRTAPRPPESRAIAAADSIARATLARHPIAGLTIAIARGNRPLMVRGYGKADVELGAPTPTDGIYQIGSVTKQFTAVAILQLVDQGKLSLDAELSTLLPDARLPGPLVTLRQLLNHTSGIAGYTEMAEFGGLIPQALPRDTLVRLMAAKPRLFAPGAAMHYNNSAYVLLGLIIEKASGLPYEQYVARELFARAGMRTARYCSTTDVIPGMVRGYDLAGRTLRPARYLDQRWPYAGGSLCASARDLIAWNAALHGGRLLSPARYADLVRPGALADGTPLRYGMGLVVGDPLAGHRALHHDGAIPGFASSLAWLPDDSLTVVVLVNTLGAFVPADLTAALVAAVAGDRRAAPVSAGSAAEALVGTYRGRNRTGGPITLRVTAANGGALSIRLDQDSALRASWQGNDVVTAEHLRLAFARAGERVTGVRVDDGYSSALYAREGADAGAPVGTAGPVLPRDAEARYGGLYELRDNPSKPGMPLRVFAEDGQLRGQIRSNTPSVLDYLGNDRFRPVDSPEFTVTFTVTGDRATGLVMEAPGMRWTGTRAGSAPAPTGASAASPSAPTSPLDRELARMDSLLFDAAFVACDTARVFAILTPDVEFYHDQTGAKRGQGVRDDFIRLAANCPRGQGVTRVLTPGSLQHFPIKDFGAMQLGEHRFEQAGRPPVGARFVHLWTNVGGTWRVSRIYSVDHAVVK